MSYCKKCGAEIVWIKTPAGKHMPCDVGIVCPYCGYRIQDDDGYFAQKGDGEYECDSCGKTFNFSVNIEVTYSTTRQESEQ